MKIQRREVMMLGALIVILAGILYYYLFFQSYLTERVTLRDSIAQAQSEVDFETAKMGQLDRMRAELEGIEQPEKLKVYDVIETGDIADKIENVCEGLATGLSMAISQPTALGSFYMVSVSVNFSANPLDLPNILNDMQNIDICDRVNVGSLMFTDGTAGDCSVSLTAEFLYTANKFPPVRNDIQETDTNLN